MNINKIKKKNKKYEFIESKIEREKNRHFSIWSTHFVAIRKQKKKQKTTKTEKKIRLNENEQITSSNRIVQIRTHESPHSNRTE